MKLLPVLALVVAFALCLRAETLDVPSKIDSVTVYQGVARVTRTFEADLPAGAKTTLRFSGLPESVNSAYVQVAVSDGAALNLGLVTFDNEYKDADKSQALKDLEARVRELEAKVAALQQERSVADGYALSRMNLVASINKGLAETGKPELYELARTAYEDAAAAAKDAYAKKTALDEQLRQTSEALTAAREAVEKQTGKEQRTCAEYKVEAVSVGGKTKGTVSYYVNGPSWMPTYIAKADTVKGLVNISYMAGVLQNSGEDWTGVELVLETSTPGAGAKPVEPVPVFLTQMSGGYGRKSSMDSMDYEARPMAAAAVVMREGNAVSVTGGMTGFRAQVKERVTVTSADNATVLPLMDRDIPCEFHTETIPLTAQTAFLVGKLKNAFPLPLLAGAMQAVVDGSTNGEGAIEETLPGEELTVGLGVNQNVVVERKVVTEKGKNSGIFGGKRVEERSYVNKITNHMKVAQQIVVRERVPISKDDKIEVKLIQPDNVTPDTEKGTFDQTVTLQPGQGVELPTIFKVAYPSDWVVSGGY